MPRKGVTESEVFAAIDQLRQDGQKPSVERIRAALGDTGSNTTILRAYRSWVEAQRRAPDDDTSCIPDNVRQVMEHALSTLWQTCTAQAGAQVAAIRAAAEAQTTSAESTLDEALESIAKLESERDDALERLSKLAAENATLKVRLQDRNTELRTIKAQVKANSSSTTALLKQLLERDERQSGG